RSATGTSGCPSHLGCAVYSWCSSVGLVSGCRTPRSAPDTCSARHPDRFRHNSGSAVSTTSGTMGAVTSLHVASFDDLDARTAYLLWQLRERVFVVEQECAYLDLDGRDLEPATRHVYVDVAG